MNAHRLAARKLVRFDVAMVEQDNFRAALAWAAAGGDVTLGLRIATALEQFWTLIDPTEGMHWYERLFEATGAADVPLETRADSMRSYGSSTDIAGFRRRLDAGTRKASRSPRSSETGAGGPSCSTGCPSTRCGVEMSRRRASSSTRATSPRAARDMWGLTQTVGAMGAIERDAATRSARVS